MVCPIFLETMEQANRINEVACTQQFDISISHGNDIVDAKSLMVLYPFIGKEVYIVMSDEVDEKYFQRLIKRMGF